MFFILVFSNTFSKNFEDDCLYLETLLSDVAIDMSLSLDENNLNVKNVLARIKSQYKAKASSEIISKEGIDKKVFANVINETYAKYSNKNGHVAIKSEDEFLMPFSHQFVYYSDVYFTKENNSYIVYKNYKNIKKGTLYTGKTDNLFKTVYKNKILYRFGTFSSKIIKDSMISIENKLYKVPVYGDVGSVKYTKDYEFKKIDNCLYLKIENCDFSDKKLEKKFFEDTEKFSNEFKNTNTIIFDFRNNLGGYSKYLKPFSYSLIFNNKTDDNDLQFSKWNKYLQSGHKRINTKTMINKTISVGLLSSDYNTYCFQNLDKKYLVEGEVEQVNLTPWYKGKIYVLINPLSCSTSEEFILSLKKLFGSNVIVIGQNSNGSLDFPDVYGYILPASKIKLNLSAIDYRETNLLKEKSWHGDTMGVFPDYWCEPKDIVKTLSFLVGNKNLEKFIKL